VWIEQLTSDLVPGRVLDLAAGEGRNAIWLAERGWDATAVDFSQVALDRARRLADERLGGQALRLHTEQADLLIYSPATGGFDLVLGVYLQIPADQRWMVMRLAAAALAPGGRLIVIAHDTENLKHGFGGPQDPDVLYTAEDIVSDLDGTDLVVERAETVVRVVTTDAGTREALDALVVAVRAA
jgi:SAM-dependent methyltransferase